MKLLPFLLFTLTCLPVIVFGQTEEIATSTEESAPIVEETAATTSAPTEIIPPVTASPAPVALEARTQERIINLAANISNRFDSIIGRLDQISRRLRTRAEKQASLGLDTSAAIASLDRAEESLARAKVEMSTIDTAVVAAIGSTDPVREWREVRQKYLVAREAIRQSHSELKNAITALKNASPVVSAEAEEPQTN